MNDAHPDTLIFADTQATASALAHRLGFEPGHWHYLSSIDQLRGVRHQHAVVHVSAMGRSDFDSTINMMRAQRCQIRTIIE